VKKILLLIVVIFSVIFGYSLATSNLLKNNRELPPMPSGQKSAILRLALVSDSHKDNENLKKALRQAGGMGINLVIGLGDYTNVGTLEELRQAKEIFDQSKLDYLLTAGDHDLWDSRDKGKDPLSNFKEVFGLSSQVFEKDNIQFVIVDNSDIYKGISQEDWEILKSIKSIKSTKSTTSSNSQQALDTRDTLNTRGTLIFVFAQKTPFHPDSKHVMGSESAQVADQAKELMTLLEDKKVDGFFSGDLHFFAEYQSPSGLVKMTTVGAVAKERNFQGPRFAILAVFDDYSWEVEDVEIR